MSPDQSTVVVTLWDHARAPDGSVDFFDAANRARWEHRWGNRERARHLQHALDHCGGRFHVVRVIARDPTLDTKTIADRIADGDTVMQITRFDPKTGEFAARPAHPQSLPQSGGEHVALLSPLTLAGGAARLGDEGA